VNSIGVMVLGHLPNTPKEQSDLVHFQYYPYLGWLIKENSIEGTYRFAY